MLNAERSARGVRPLRPCPCAQGMCASSTGTLQGLRRAEVPGAATGVIWIDDRRWTTVLRMYSVVHTVPPFGSMPSKTSLLYRTPLPTSPPVLPSQTMVRPGKGLRFPLACWLGPISCSSTTMRKSRGNPCSSKVAEEPPRGPRAQELIERRGTRAGYCFLFFVA